MRRVTRGLAISLLLAWLLAGATGLLNGFAVQPTTAAGDVIEQGGQVFLIQTVDIRPGEFLRIDAPDFAGAPMTVSILAAGEGRVLANGGTPEHILAHLAAPYRDEPIWYERPATDAADAGVDIVWTLPSDAEGPVTAQHIRAWAFDVVLKRYDATLLRATLITGALALPAALLSVGFGVMWVVSGAPGVYVRSKWPVVIVGSVGVVAVILVGRALLVSVINRPGAFGPAGWWAFNLLLAFHVAALLSVAWWWRSLSEVRLLPATA